jgi:hypothetical protein
MQLQAKDCQQLLEARKREEGKRDSIHSSTSTLIANF